MRMDIPTIIGVLMLLGSAGSLYTGGRRSVATDRVWRSSVAVVVLAVLHLAFLWQFFGPTFGKIGSEEWAAITAAAILGMAADDDADMVGFFLVFLAGAQIFMLAGLLNLSA